MGNTRMLAVIGAVTVALVLALGLAGSALAFAPWGQTQTPGPNVGPGWGCGGWGGNQGYGPGGMMGGGAWRGNVNPAGEPITIQEAAKAVADYVAAGNWSEELVVDEVMEFEYNFYAIVKEKATGIGAFELLVDKYTGYAYPEMGPNMMWNTKYGHMRGFGGMMGGGMMGGRWGGGNNGWWGPNLQSAPTADMPITPEQATTKANEYLARYGAAQSVEEPVAFYGYYTLHTVGADGGVTGMLSVNGYTGAVWYHNWHGDFIQEIEGEHTD